MTTAADSKVLIVDDDEATAELERRALQRAGLRTGVTHTVRGAVELLGREAWSAIVLDYHLPDGDAWSVVDLATSRSPRVPVILVTAMGSERIAAEALHRDVSQYVKKADSFWEQLPSMVERVTLEARAEESSRRAEALFNLLSQNASDMILTGDAEGTLKYVSPACTDLLGYAPAELIGRRTRDIVHPDDVTKTAAAQAGADRGQRYTATVRVRCKDGSWKWVESNVYAARDAAGAVTELISIVRDVTQRKRAEELLAQHTEELKQLNDDLKSLSLCDSLTGLYNRRGFFTLATPKLKEAVRSGSEVHLVFADVDGLKAINDSLGHREGDLAIVGAAEVLRATFRDTDLIARLGGDEFVLLLATSGDEAARAMQARLQQSLEEYNDRGMLHRLSISFGVSRFRPDKTSTIDDLLAKADAELYEQKRRRREAP